MVAVLRLDNVAVMRDVVGGLVARADRDLDGVVQVALCDGLDFAPHGGGEHPGEVLFGKSAEDLVDVLLEAHVEHLVGLVEDEDRDGVEVDYAARHHVEQSARGRDDDVRAAPKLVDLRVDAGAAVDGDDVDALEVCRELAHVEDDLHAEFAGGAEDDALRATVFRRDAREKRQAVGAGLARAGLREADEVGVLAEKDRYGLLLDFSWCLESKVRDGLEELFVQSEFCEVHGWRLVVVKRLRG